MASSGLRAHHAHRLELADIVRAALHLARARSDDQAVDDARRLLTAVAEDTFQLAVVGQFSRGKSTLMNALLGDGYLPTGALPMTSVVTTVRYGSRARAVVRRRGSGLPIEVGLHEVARFVAQSSAERSELQVATVDIEVPAEMLRLGFAFVDTPGVGSAIEVNTATTRRFLPRADAVVFVTGFDSALTASEVEFLTEVRQHVEKIFFVVNKRDLVTAAAADEVLRFVVRRLRGTLYAERPRIFALSALHALHARVRDDRQSLEDSGLPPLERALVEFLTHEKSELFLQNLRTRARRLIAQEQHDLDISVGIDDAESRRQVEKRFDAAVGDLTARQRELADAIDRRVRAELPDLLAARMPSWSAELEAALADDVADQAAALHDVRQFETAGTALEESGRRLGAEWLVRHAPEVHETIAAIAADDINRLLALTREPRRLGAELVGHPLPDPHGPVTGWFLTDLPTVLTPMVSWPPGIERPRRHALSPRGARDGGLAATLRAGTATAVSDFVAGAMKAYVEVAGQWVDRLQDQVARETASAAEIFRHQLRTPATAEDRRTVVDLVDRIDRLSTGLAAWPGGDDRPAEDEPVAAARPAATCPVCHRLERTLGDHLRLDQFRLATRAQEQVAHARLGGFCALHTWHYAAIASPLGVSAGYASLAAALADRLEEAARPDSGSAARVAELVQRSEHCPVCRDLDSAETNAVRAVVQSGRVPPVLCLRHLALTVADLPSPEKKAEVIRAVAQVLRRDSEDMRAYALKREALHSGLVTEEESRAYSETIRILAGEQSLAQPWFQDES